MLRRRAVSGEKRTGAYDHIVLALRAFVRLEQKRWATGKSWYECKRELLRDAIRHARQVWQTPQTTTA